MPVHLRDKIGTTLRSIIRMPTYKWGILSIRQLSLSPVGLVTGGNDNSTNAFSPASGLKHIPGALNVRTEGRQRILVGNTNDRLCTEMENDFNFVFVKRAFKERMIF